MSQKANNWSHTSERGSLQQALADAGVQSGPAVTGGVMAPTANMPVNQGLATTSGPSGGSAVPVVNSAELRPYQSGRLGLDSEMVGGIETHGPNGPYPTRPAGESDPHQISTKLPTAGQHNEMNIPVTGGTMGNHPTMGERAKAAVIPGRNAHEQAAIDRTRDQGLGANPTMGERAKAAVIPGRDAHEQAAMDRTGQTSHGMGNNPTMGERAKAAVIPGRNAHEQAAMDRTGQTMSSGHGIGDNPTMGERAKAAVIPGRDAHEQAALDRSGYSGTGMTSTYGTTGTDLHPTMGERAKAAMIPGRNAHEQAAMDQSGYAMADKHTEQGHTSLKDKLTGHHTTYPSSSTTTTK